MPDPPDGFFDDFDRGNVRSLPIDRVPPHDIEAEKAILSLILVGETTEPVRRILRPEHFYSDANRQIYLAAVAVELAGGKPDILSVRGKLDDDGKLQRVGGSEALIQIVGSPGGKNPEGYAQRLRDKYTLRQLIATAQRIAAEGYSAADVSTFVSASKKSLDEVEASTDSAIETRSVLDVFAPQPPVPWLVKGLYLAPGRPALIAGYGYSAKSVSGQALLLAVAAGVSVWGEHDVQRPGRVLHLDHEQGARATFLRYQRLARAMGIGPEDLGDRLHVAPLPRSFRLSNPDAEDMLERATQGFALCLIDSLRATTPGLDENDSAIREHLDKLLRVSERTGCAFVVIHHAGKNGKEKDARERGRGSSAIFDACGLVLQLDGKVQDDGCTLVEVTMTKAPADASGAALQPFTLKVSDVMGDEGHDERWGLGCKVVDSDEQEKETPAAAFLALKERVVACVKQTPGVNGVEAIRVRLRVRKADVVQAVAELIHEERIENRGTKSRPELFFVGRTVPEGCQS